MELKLPESLAVTLLDKLGNDDTFRDAFVADARSALASIGFSPAADAGVSNGVWNCLSVTALASKQVIRASYTTLLHQLTTEKAGAHPITLEMQRQSTLRAA